VHVEGCPISVALSFTLPAQPSTGNVNYIPLGGDGFTAPIAAYGVSGATVAGDVSSGIATINLTMDNRYCSLVGYATGRILQGTPADAELRMAIGVTAAPLGKVPLQVDQGDVTAIAATVSPDSIAKTWLPPSIILPGGVDAPVLSLAATNVDGDFFTIDALIYLFNIRVRELTPMGPILFSRGSN